AGRGRRSRPVSTRRELPMRALPALALLSLLSTPLLAQAGEPFPHDCTLLFEDISMDHFIDRNCGPEGDSSSAATALQNRAKNNFCAHGDPVRITRKSFVLLQRAADDAGVDSGSPPEDRTPLQNLHTTSDGQTIGEGSLVQFVGFVLDAHYSNVSKGESVNCK